LTNLGRAIKKGSVGRKLSGWVLPGKKGENGADKNEDGGAADALLKLDGDYFSKIPARDALSFCLSLFVLPSDGS
jgi:hypothetical protein